MEISGKVFKILPLQSGEGKNGPWKKQEFILETQAQFPKKVCFSLWGDKVDQARLQENESITVSFDLESREFNGRWYTDAKAWKVVKSGEEALPPPAPPGAIDEYLMPDTSGVPDDLPF
ncbi:MAG: DUF3127 domain-containing protein [Bacteroidetes bacterium]|nr:DUF3127 domain-containing protein [Bacteroidota bacterium]